MKRTIKAVFLFMLCAGALSFAATDKPVSAVVSLSNGGTSGTDAMEYRGYYTRYFLKDTGYVQTHSIFPVEVNVQMDETVDSIRYDLKAVRYYYGALDDTASTQKVLLTLIAPTKTERPSEGKFSYSYDISSDSAEVRNQRFYEIYNGIVALDSIAELYAWVEYKLKGENYWHESDRYVSDPLRIMFMRTVRVTTTGDGSGSVSVEYTRKGVTYKLENLRDTVLYLHSDVHQMKVSATPDDSSAFNYWTRRDGSYINSSNHVVNFRGDTVLIAEFNALYYKVDFPKREADESKGIVTVVNNTTGAMMGFTQTHLPKKTELTFTAIPHDGYFFECWARQKNDECVSTTNPLKIQLTQDTSLYAKLVRPPFQAYLQLSYKMQGAKKITIDKTTQSQVDLVYTRDSLGFILPIKGGPTTGNIYCKLQASPDPGFPASKIVSSRVFKGKVIDAYVKDSMTFSLGISKLGVFSGKNIKFDPYTYFRMQVYSDDASIDTVYTKEVRITWYNPVYFINAEGAEIWTEAKLYNEKVKVPTDRSLFALPRETDSTRYSYHWESVDGTRIEATTESVYATDSAHYHLVADNIMFRVRYLDYEGYAYRTEWLDSNTTIKDAPKPNTLQDAAYWIRAVGGSRDLPLVLDGPADIHAAYDYKVRFLDYDGNELSEGFVSYGKAATPPEKEPTRDGYVFDGWDKKFNKVTDTMTVTATYKKAKATSSSSSAKAKSSSSKAKSSSSKGKDAIVAAAQVPQFMLTAVGREIQVAGARVGSAYAVLDMQGRVIAKGRVNATDFSVDMDRSATYLVRIGSQTQRVKVGSRQ